jgi:oxygen-dependent protoporphyrinogen oxidase
LTGDAATRVVIVGAGIAGLAAAHALTADATVEVVLIEAAPAVGGKLRVSEIAGMAVDEGAETFLARAPEGVGLIEAVGLGDQLVSPATTSAGVWIRGSVRPLPSRTVLGVPSSARSLGGVLSVPEVARAALDRLLPGAPPGSADVAVGDWVGRRLGRAVVDLLVDPLLGGVYAGSADRLSLQATAPMLDRTHRSALAAAAASAPPVPVAGPSPVFCSLTGGMGSLPGAVLRASGVHLVSGRAVRAIRATKATPANRPDRADRSEPRDHSATEPRGWQVVHGPTTDERVIDADAVILATPAAPTARLLADLCPAAGTDLAGIDYASMAIITTAWRVVDAAPFSGRSGYLVPTVSRPRRPVKAVTFASSKWAHLAGSAEVIVRCSIGRHGETADLQRDDGDLIAAAVAELTSFAGFRGRPVESRVTRWGGALPQYAVGHRDRVARVRAALAVLPGVQVCGAAYDGVGVPACIRSGQQAATAVLAGLSAPAGR